MNPTNDHGYTTEAFMADNRAAWRWVMFWLIGVPVLLAAFMLLAWVQYAHAFPNFAPEMLVN